MMLTPIGMKKCSPQPRKSNHNSSKKVTRTTTTYITYDDVLYHNYNFYTDRLYTPSFEYWDSDPYGYSHTVTVYHQYPYPYWYGPRWYWWDPYPYHSYLSFSYWDGDWGLAVGGYAPYYHPSPYWAWGGHYGWYGGYHLAYWDWRHRHRHHDWRPHPGHPDNGGANDPTTEPRRQSRPAITSRYSEPRLVTNPAGSPSLRPDANAISVKKSASSLTDRNESTRRESTRSASRRERTPRSRYSELMVVPGMANQTRSRSTTPTANTAVSQTGNSAVSPGSRVETNTPTRTSGLTAESLRNNSLRRNAVESPSLRPRESSRYTDSYNARRPGTIVLPSNSNRRSNSIQVSPPRTSQNYQPARTNSNSKLYISPSRTYDANNTYNGRSTILGQSRSSSPRTESYRSYSPARNQSYSTPSQSGNSYSTPRSWTSSSGSSSSSDSYSSPSRNSSGSTSRSSSSYSSPRSSSGSSSSYSAPQSSSSSGSRSYSAPRSSGGGSASRSMGRSSSPSRSSGGTSPRR